MGLGCTVARVFVSDTVGPRFSSNSSAISFYQIFREVWN